MVAEASFSVYSKDSACSRSIFTYGGGWQEPEKISVNLGWASQLRFFRLCLLPCLNMRFVPFTPTMLPF